MAKGQLRKKIPELRWALEGTMGDHQRFMLQSQLDLLEFLNKQITELDQEVDERFFPFKVAVERIDGIPGVGRRTAQDILAEIGTDMSRFPTAAHLSSWAKVSPGNNENRETMVAKDILLL